LKDSKVKALPGDDGRMDLSHLRREARTALELAIVALAPSQLVDRLAAAAGLLEALTDLPAGSPPVAATLPRALSRTKSTLEEWRRWQEQHRGKRIPRG
jgi:hypothetical protein